MLDKSHTWKLIIIHLANDEPDGDASVKTCIETLAEEKGTEIVTENLGIVVLQQA